MRRLWYRWCRRPRILPALQCELAGWLQRSCWEEMISHWISQTDALGCKHERAAPFWPSGVEEKIARKMEVATGTPY